MPGQVTPQELSSFFATVVLAKLFAFEQTGSDKHLRDVKGVLVTQWGRLNLDLIRRAADQRNLLAQFEQLLECARREIFE